MRSWIAFVALMTWLIASHGAMAAPTCLDKSGGTIRCATAGAMPVGWTPSPEQRKIWELSRPPQPSANDVLKIAFGIGLLLALIALLPEFDGSRDADWEKQDGEE